MQMSYSPCGTSQTTSASRYSSIPTPTLINESIRHTSTLERTPQRRTICALSTPPEESGVAVTRISGPDAFHVWQRMVRPTRATATDETRPSTHTRNGNYDASQRQRHLPEAWNLERCHVVDPHTAEHLDDALSVIFRGASPLSFTVTSAPPTRQANLFTPYTQPPRSFTTEDVLELHVHGGRAVISAVLAALARVPGCRRASPGEFSRRAHEGGRLDLTQVEGLQDLGDAVTDSQRRAALRVAGGETRDGFCALREEIVGRLALVEALIDFGEGEDIEEGVFEEGACCVRPPI
ncbi:GTP-binding protein TrmE N-terminus-domain-containing protein [Russula earlei]|uniref:GTP-binding protein TrmE N-terminus-domain-containing protein n=1 Tax=Russula earlei TaxID=71964 RepID=A0ACC0UME0_9AGAM|nr:GTP-binding protein TrmE N-terminus-domain-containing protein [Russula earlei]